ncbi:hypothetical protein [Bradyrhizobium neotropicale]|uniref:hypothetical protein n=1 Tax=Bradyrhizobium neotropicale TaxID=1497615 RepID=UPI001AD60D02|nr:hypothetical protein [Bradyrhizobium neotropicale]MBO4222283.1 hypothetical protein [Bradyrhizobium neotropicale]
MRKIGLALLFGAFASLMVYVSAGRLLEWYRTGQLAAHKKLVLGGPDIVTYSGDPIGFIIEFDFYLFLLSMGVLGVLIACRDILLEVGGPGSFVDLRRIYLLAMLSYWLLAGGLLIVAAFSRAA